MYQKFFLAGLSVLHSFAYVFHFVFLRDRLDSNPEIFRSKQARYQLSRPSS